MRRVLWYVGCAVCVGLLVLGALGIVTKSPATVSAKPLEITGACERPLEEYLLLAERGLKDSSSTRDSTNVIGYILLHNACLARGKQ